MLQEFPDKSARAECRIALKVPGSEAIVFTGVCEGTIVAPRGENNFGWDPIFQPNNFDQTFAEMPMDTKNSISHRGNAMKLALEYLQSKPTWTN
jgi:inosine triphosphate pyrophosphatase